MARDKLDANRIVWQADEDKPWQMNGFLPLPDRPGDYAWVAHFWCELGCVGYWNLSHGMWNGITRDGTKHGPLKVMRICDAEMKEFEA